MVADPVLVRGLGFTADGDFQAAPPTATAPTIIKWTRADFVSQFLNQVGVPANDDPSQAAPGVPGRADLCASTVNVGVDDGGLLFQPVHRVFYLATLEVVCDVAGEPRLDPDKIDSAGLVVRRVSLSASDGELPERWTSKFLKTAWRPSHTEDDADLDPDPTQRPGGRSGNPEIDKALDAAKAGSEALGLERITRLFVASRSICKTVGRTILFGAVQLASSEVEHDTSTAASTYSATDDIAAPHGLPHFFRQGVNISLNGIAGRTYQIDTTQQGDPITYWDGTSWQTVDLTGLISPKPLDHFVKMLQRMVAEFDLLGDGNAALVGALDGVTFTYDDGSTEGMGQALVEAARLFVTGDSTVSARIPAAWPVLSQAQADAIATAALGAANGRLAKLVPQQGRFDAPGRQYQIRAFVRVKRDDGCPPKLFWSDYTPPFTIAPWHQRCPDVPPVQISLPEVTKDNVKSFLPNVAFNVPGGIMSLLAGNSPKDFLDGKASLPSGGGGGLAWICGFNIPIITLCAFIVLNIFLSLLNIIFWWMAFIKICIPVPASLKARLPSGVVK